MKNNIGFRFKKNSCCGCGVCKNGCPVKAITMKNDSEGFVYPVVEEDKCINCKKCINLCPMINKEFSDNQYDKPLTFAVKHKDNNIRSLSRSGGIFSALTDCVLSCGGIVYGCALDKDFVAHHIRADNHDDRNRMRGSKYVQSEIADIYNYVINDLKNGKSVVYSGTSCQIQAVKNIVPNSLQDNLYTVDIVCHGVPSPLVWKNYLQMCETKYGGKVTGVDFRNKTKYGWKDHVETITIDNVEYDSKVYTNMFYNHLIIRPSCYNCPYKRIIHPGDITIADCWGIDKLCKTFNDDKGVSLVLVNNEKGKIWFDKVVNEVDCISADINKCSQPPFHGNYIIPSNRNKFWKMYKTKGIESVCQVYGKRMKPSLLDKIKRKIKSNR